LYQTLTCPEVWSAAAASTPDVRAVCRAEASVGCAQVVSRARGRSSVATAPARTAQHRSVDTHAGLSVWEPTGRSRSAAASTTMRSGGSGLSRNQNRSPCQLTDRYPAQSVV